MIFEDFPFDPVRDLQPVDQFGFVDLKVALDSSCVPSQMPDSEQDYNGIDNPDSILGKPHDIFDAIDLQKALESSVSADNVKSGEKNDSE